MAKPGFAKFSRRTAIVLLLVSCDAAFGSWWPFGNEKSESVEDATLANSEDDDVNSLMNDIKAFHHDHDSDTRKEEKDTSIGVNNDTKDIDNLKETNNEKIAIEVEQPPPPPPIIEYGVDVSFPMHHAKVSDNFAWLKHNTDPSSHSTPRELEGKPISPFAGRQEFYDRFLEGCVEHYGHQGRMCISSEEQRIEMTLRQPQSMQNYTETGFKKIKTPEKLFKMITDFWEENKDKQTKEQWGGGNTYTNNWDTPTYMVSVEDRRLRGGGSSLKQQIWNEAQSIIQEWTGQELTQCSLYGVRVYKTDAILSPHVDRLPLVSSAIINVDADVDEPWPLEVIGHDGRATNVTMVPGDMVLYESHSVIHGRPFPLKGKYVANLFIHFEPTGHTLRHNGDAEDPEGQDVHAKYRKAVENGVGGHETNNNGIPPYIIPGTPEDFHYRRTHPTGQAQQKKSQFVTGSTTPLHLAAQNGELDAVKTHLTTLNGKVNVADKNGWTPLHEASRGGHTDVVKFLLDSGAHVNMGTVNGETALYWAKKHHGEDHPVVGLLMEAGGVEMGPEL